MHFSDSVPYLSHFWLSYLNTKKVQKWNLKKKILPVGVKESMVQSCKKERGRACTHHFNELSSGMGLAIKMASSDVCVWFCSLRHPCYSQGGNDRGWLDCPKQSALAASERTYGKDCEKLSMCSPLISKALQWSSQIMYQFPVQFFFFFGYFKWIWFAIPYITVHLTAVSYTLLEMETFQKNYKYISLSDHFCLKYENTQISWSILQNFFFWFLM